MKSSWVATAFVVACLVVAGTGVPVSEAADTSPKLTAEDLAAGERMYRDGIFPSGESMRALVQGDIEVDGRQFTCVSCHRRSGMGSSEGNIIAPELVARVLYQPRLRGALKQPAHPEQLLGRSGRFQITEEPVVERPAYDDASLARAIRAGIDPAGKVIDHLMPRYPLGERDMQLLIDYLKTLSAEPSPGVTDTAIHIATIITDEVPVEDRNALLAVLETWIAGRNSQWRNDEKRARHGPLMRQMFDAPYRALALAQWILTGPPETWRAQLEAYYRQQPVFLLVSGISTQGWRPIHEFCEANRIPDLFPITDLPVISDTDYYTLYFSKGLTLEAQAVAKYLHDQAGIAPAAEILQVHRAGASGAVAAQAFHAAWAAYGGSAARSQAVAQAERIDRAFWERLAETNRPAILLLWLDAQDLTGLAGLAAAAQPPGRVLLSSSLLDGDTGSVPAELRERVYLAHPYNLPETFQRRFPRVSAWLRSKGKPVGDERIQSKAFITCMMLGENLMHIKSDFHRDYFLEKLEHVRDPRAQIAAYPHLTFGPGQRYASKGCYIVQIATEPRPTLVDKSGWLIP